MHEKSAIAGEKRPLVRLHHIKEPGIIQLIVIDDINSEQPKIANQLTQVPVSDKPLEVPLLERFAGQICRPNRININLRSVAYNILKIDRSAPY